MNKRDLDNLKENMIFVGTIYDSFEALEETLGALKMEEALFMTYAAKKSFASTLMKKSRTHNLKH